MWGNLLLLPSKPPHFGELYSDFPGENHPSPTHNHVLSVEANLTSESKDEHVTLTWPIQMFHSSGHRNQIRDGHIGQAGLWLELLGEAVSLLPLLKGWCISLALPGVILPPLRESLSESDANTLGGQSQGWGGRIPMGVILAPGFSHAWS